MIERINNQKVEQEKENNRFCICCNEYVPWKGSGTTVTITNTNLDFIGVLCSLACMFKYNKNREGYKGRRRCQEKDAKEQLKTEQPVEEKQ